MQKLFSVEAQWDDEAHVYVSKSDIVGLHIEAETIEEFERVMREEAPRLIVENHISRAERATGSILDLIPGILWTRPDPAELACA